MFGRCKPAEQTNPQPSSYAAQNAATHSENTHKHSEYQTLIFDIALKLQRLGYSEAYITTMVKALRKMAKHCNLFNPNEALTYIAKLNAMESYKANLCDFYKHFADYYNIPFVKPRYRRDHKLPYVPTTEEINLFIAHSKSKYAVIYSIMRDTGMRPIEVSNLKLKDIDLENGVINVYSAKHGIPRMVKVKPSTLAMIKDYVQKYKFELDDKLFPSSDKISNTFCRLRHELAKKLQNPKLKNIKLYSFRHFYATSLYYETKDILLTKEMLGHKNINNTMIYTHLVRLDKDDKFYSATAKTIEEASKLIEHGFEHVTTFNNIMLFRKRK
jgi:integrase